MHNLFKESQQTEKEKKRKVDEKESLEEGFPVNHVHSHSLTEQKHTRQRNRRHGNTKTNLI